MKKLVVSVIVIFFAISGLYAQEVIKLYDGKAPGSENWDWDETELGGGFPMVYNVTDPSLIVCKPEKEVATGKAVVVCPGGAFLVQAIGNEGYDVAKWLNSKGITVFILKYRLDHMESNDIAKEMADRKIGTEEHAKSIQPIIEMAIADGRTAVSYVKQHASEWSLNPDSVGIMGFSAGGTVASGVAFTYDEESRPAFVAPIYPYVGYYAENPVPADAPPMFIACTTDDGFGFHTHATKLYNKWVTVQKATELHMYQKGEHGFAVKKQGLAVDGWTELFIQWLDLQGKKSSSEN
ncbi:alpha/beta hydrolase [uncultured Draconibacterium sp.]|uniref:alpha/beta hydrolase n=1 Tax=uncultured Draconibacterium sp. TaxID=1573823 RepID=UPI0025CE291D|nr:alpha/beta hydrolase [uncultured Draconibacterium sp.]